MPAIILLVLIVIVDNAHKLYLKRKSNQQMKAMFKTHRGHFMFKGKRLDARVDCVCDGVHLNTKVVLNEIPEGLTESEIKELASLLAKASKQGVLVRGKTIKDLIMNITIGDSKFIQA